MQLNLRRLGLTWFHSRYAGVLTVNRLVKCDQITNRRCCCCLQVAIIIPFRHRENHLKYWLHYLHPILRRQRIDYGIYIINQVGLNTRGPERARRPLCLQRPGEWQLLKRLWLVASAPVHRSCKTFFFNVLTSGWTEHARPVTARSRPFTSPEDSCLAFLSN